MTQLILLNLLLLAVIAIVLFILKKTVSGEKAKFVTLLVSSLLTVACHYSSLLYHFLRDRSGMAFLASNPNLVLPIYPCNVVMWGCVLYGFCKNKASRFARFMADYLFWFGLFSALIGMFANVDFVRNPTFADYDVTKGILSHAFMLLNVLLIPLLGYIKVDFVRNYRHILLSMLMMLLIGCYCNLLFEVLVSRDMALLVNSMFLLHSPFEGADYLRYPFICLVAAVFYFLLLNVCELFAYKKGERWPARRKNKKQL